MMLVKEHDNKSEHRFISEQQSVEARPRGRGPSARSAGTTELLNSLIKTLTTIQVIVDTQLNKLKDI